MSVKNEILFFGYPNQTLSLHNSFHSYPNLVHRTERDKGDRLIDLAHAHFVHANSQKEKTTSIRCMVV